MIWSVFSQKFQSFFQFQYSYTWCIIISPTNYCRQLRLQAGSTLLQSNRWLRRLRFCGSWSRQGATAGGNAKPNKDTHPIFTVTWIKRDRSSKEGGGGWEVTYLGQLKISFSSQQECWNDRTVRKAVRLDTFPGHSY